MNNPTVFAPLAGISHLPMRLLAKRAGCALVYSEMISASGLTYGAAKTIRMLASTAEEKPLAVQLFGSDPEKLARAAQIAETSGADIVDINFGCAVKKILKSNSGAALMRDPQHAAKLLQAVRSVIHIPLTIKMRTGWEPSGTQAMALAHMAEATGVDAVAVHPRTAQQAFRGSADWSLIGRIKDSLNIPVIGNGDITCAEDAARMIAETGCDAVMIGRAAIGNPFIFSDTINHLNGRPPGQVTVVARFRVIDDYVNACVDSLGERSACFMLRSKLGWFTKGLPHASRFRNAVRCVESKAQIIELLEAYQAFILSEE
ncbi:MAG: tRNA dihydrouridine synthase DusB [Desulfatitalea sp.]|nr:tRNA dihydrouridine synthase DusB [Desulfatitalea sp.]NNK02045.1 tRNA dihydrouridine synthase DusB [Desulfatitalea sp.]